MSIISEWVVYKVTRKEWYSTMGVGFRNIRKAIVDLIISRLEAGIDSPENATTDLLVPKEFQYEAISIYLGKEFHYE